MKKLLLFLTLFGGFYIVQSQTQTASIKCISGCGEIEFYFNTLSKYENGIASPVTTRLRISFQDTQGTPDTWALAINSDNNVIDRDDGAIDLDLDAVYITPSCATCPNPVVLTDQVLPDNALAIPVGPFPAGTPAGQYVFATGPENIAATPYYIDLDWTCGTGAGGGQSVFRHDPGYYSVNVVLNLVSIDTP